MPKLSKQLYYYIGIHVAVPTLFLISPLFLHINFFPLKLMMGCFFKDALHLYCPLCGGTRAVEALSRFDFTEALAYNAAVVAFVIFLIVWDVACLIRLLLKKERWWTLPKKTWWVIVAVFLGYTLVRNLLMVFCGIDSIGDLVLFWH